MEREPLTGLTSVLEASVAGVLGLLIGSFLNVVIHRVPRGESIVSPPSACPNCGHQIRNRHNIPVLGWLVLRGRCADCGEPISARYPLVELGTGVLFAVVALRVSTGSTDGGWALLAAYLFFGAVSVALVFAFATVTVIGWDVLPAKFVSPW